MAHYTVFRKGFFFQGWPGSAMVLGKLPVRRAGASYSFGLK